MLRIVALAVGLLITAGSSRAFAWGCEGHQVVAMLAEHVLSPATINALKAELAASPVDPGIKPYCPPVPSDIIAEAAIWADDYRELEPSTGGWHFINFPLAAGKNIADYKKYCPKGNCVIDAIVSQYQTLKTSTDPKLKANALRFIIHFVGDLHQPLHTVTNGDRGGNCVPVTYFNEAPKEDERHSFRPNLHGVWDDSSIRRLMTTQGLADSRAFADYILKRSALHVAAARAPTSLLVASWAREANAIARDVTYGRLPVKVPTEPADALTLSSCADNNNVGQRMANLHVQITDRYEQASVPAILGQIRLAAERLAALLEAAFPL